MDAPLEQGTGEQSALPNIAPATGHPESTLPAAETETRKNNKRKRTPLPKKKKHRPRVVKDGANQKPPKPPVTPKPVTPLPKEKPIKRKYERKKNKQNTSLLATPKHSTPSSSQDEKPIKRTYERRKNKQNTTLFVTPKPSTPPPDEKPIKRKYEQKDKQNTTLFAKDDNHLVFTVRKPRSARSVRRRLNFDWHEPAGGQDSAMNNTENNNHLVFTVRKPRSARSVRRRLNFDLNEPAGGQDSAMNNTENKAGETTCYIALSKDTASSPQCVLELAQSPLDMEFDVNEHEIDLNWIIKDAELKAGETPCCIAPSKYTVSSAQCAQECPSMLQSPADMACNLNEPEEGHNLVLSKAENKAGERPCNIAPVKDIASSMQFGPELSAMVGFPSKMACDLHEPERRSGSFLTDAENKGALTPSCYIVPSEDNFNQECESVFGSPSDMACDSFNGLLTGIPAHKQIFSTGKLNKKEEHYPVTSDAANDTFLLPEWQTAGKKANPNPLKKKGSHYKTYERRKIACKDHISKAPRFVSGSTSNAIWGKQKTKQRKAKRGHAHQAKLETTSSKFVPFPAVYQRTVTGKNELMNGASIMHFTLSVHHYHNEPKKSISGILQILRSMQESHITNQAKRIPKVEAQSPVSNSLQATRKSQQICIAPARPEACLVVRESKLSKSLLSKKDPTAKTQIRNIKKAAFLVNPGFSNMNQVHKNVPYENGCPAKNSNTSLADGFRQAWQLIQHESGQSHRSFIDFSRRTAMNLPPVSPVNAIVPSTIYADLNGGREHFISGSQSAFVHYNASLANDFQENSLQPILYDSVWNDRIFADFSESSAIYLPPVPFEQHITYDTIDPNLHRGQANMISQEEKSLVLYNAGGAIVPHQNTNDRIKKRYPQAKVDLDEDSLVMWNILMGEDEAKGVNIDFEKWRREREIFAGRSTSFIARMRSIQGSKAFSRWRGSVLDSVVGVFLTQNVSDQLSSSAFMSLAARFPAQSKDSNCEPNARNEHMKHDVMANACFGLDSVTMTDCTPANRTHVHELESDFASKTPASTADILATLTASLEKVEVSLVEDELTSPKSVEPENTSIDPMHVSNHIPSSSELNCKAEDLPVKRKSSNSGPPSCLEPPTITIATEMQEVFNHDEKLIASRGDSTFSPCKIYPEGNSQHEAEIPSQMPECKTDGTCSDPLIKQLEVQSLDDKKGLETNLRAAIHSSPKVKHKTAKNTPKAKNARGKDENKTTTDWESLRKRACCSNAYKRNHNTLDSVDWVAVRNAGVDEIAATIKNRGQHNILAGRIKDFLDKLVEDHGSMELEWLRDIPPDKAKEYLLGINGLGIKSVECVRLLSLHHHAFPVDTNVGRICVRLGWVPLQPLPESVQLHLLDMYPIMDQIQKYLWPRLCTLDQETLYELHYQMITFGKVFCTKRAPNCNACPMRGECKHFASAFASARLPLPAPEEKSLVSSSISTCFEKDSNLDHHLMPLTQLQGNHYSQGRNSIPCCEPIIEEPSTPEHEVHQSLEIDIEDMFSEDPDEIPEIKLNLEELKENVQSIVKANQIGLEEGDVSKALVLLTQEAASIPMQKLKNISRLRTEHQVYELPDSHPLLEGMDQREHDDPNHYLLVIWTQGARTTESPEIRCNSQVTGDLCDEDGCVSCNSIREEKYHTVRGTLLIPSRTAMKGSFPLNGTYFQCNEVFADHESSQKPMNVPRGLIWNLRRRTAYFGTSVSTINKGLTMEEIQMCFHRGVVCVRGFNRKTRAPMPLHPGLHITGSDGSKRKKTAEREE